MKIITLHEFRSLMIGCGSGMVSVIYVGSVPSWKAAAFYFGLALGSAIIEGLREGFRQ